MSPLHPKTPSLRGEAPFDSEKAANPSRVNSLSKDPPMGEKIRSSCDACLKTKVKCSQTKPSCARCTQHDRQCVYSQSRKPGRPSKTIGDSAGPKDQQPRTARDARRKSLKQSHQQQTVQNHAQADRQAHQYHEDQLYQVPNMTTIHALGTPMSHSSSSGAGSDVGIVVDTGNPTANARDSALRFDDNYFGLESMADFMIPLDYALEDTDFWEGLFDPSAAMSPIITDVQDTTPRSSYSGTQSHLDDILTGYISPSSSESRLPLDENRFSALYPSPAQSLEGLFPSCPSGTFSAGNTVSLLETLGTEAEAGYIRETTSPSSFRSASLTGESNLYSVSTSSSRCTLQCQLHLTNQLTEITEFQVKESRVSLDVLLNLDDNVRKTRDRIITCSFCLATPRFPQTLMLLTMVIGDLLSLFERSCGNLILNTKTTSSPTDSNSPCNSTPGNPLPNTMGPLAVGDIQLDETVKQTFSRRLISMYLSRQLLVVQQLKQLLDARDRGNVSSKITLELLEDMSRRFEFFIAFITLKGALDVSTVC